MAKQVLRGMRVAVLTADGFEQVEVTEPVDALEDAGAEVEIVAPRSGSIQGMNHMAHGKKVDVDVTLAEADASDYDALLLPGGLFAPDTLRLTQEALDFVRAFEYAGKPIAAICHGPWLLVSAGLARGRRLTSWPNIQDDVRNAGGLWEDGSLVHDRNWVSSRGPQDIRKFRKGIVDHFASYAPAGVPNEWDEELDDGGMSIGSLIASGLALAAVSYGVKRLQSSMSSGEGDEFTAPRPGPATTPRVASVELVEEVVVVAPRDTVEPGVTPPLGYDAPPPSGYGPTR